MAYTGAKIASARTQAKKTGDSISMSLVFGFVIHATTAEWKMKMSKSIVCELCWIDVEEPYIESHLNAHQVTIDVDPQPEGDFSGASEDPEWGGRWASKIFLRV